MATATLIGSTGLVGSYILSTLLPSPHWTSITTISRRAPKAPADPGKKLSTTLSSNLEEWPGLLPTPASTVVFSALGTTRAAAGGLANQWKVDHDANVALCKAAKAQGVKTFVFVSSVGTRSFPSRLVPYSKMKNGVEDAIKEAGFDHAIILHPGLIMGQREQPRAMEGALQGLFGGIGKLSPWVKDMIGQDASVIGRAAVRAAELAEEGKAPSQVWFLEPADILKYGRPDEKKEEVAGAGK